MSEITVWACKKCGRCGKGEQCRECGGSMAQIAEDDAIRRFTEACEPPTGWYDYEDMKRAFDEASR